MTEAEATEIIALLENIQDITKKNLAELDALAARVELIIKWLPSIPNAR